MTPNKIARKNDHIISRDSILQSGEMSSEVNSEVSSEILDKLPKDVWFKIFNYLSTKSLLNFSATCSTARNFLTSLKFMRALF